MTSVRRLGPVLRTLGFVLLALLLCSAIFEFAGYSAWLLLVNIAEGAVFILPVCIDDTRESDALVPEQFKAVHIVRMPDGEPPAEFLRRLHDLFSRKQA